MTGPERKGRRGAGYDEEIRKATELLDLSSRVVCVRVGSRPGDGLVGPPLRGDGDGFSGRDSHRDDPKGGGLHSSRGRHRSVARHGHDPGRRIHPVRKIVPWPFAPVWIIALWVLFTGSFSLSLRQLHGRPLLACLLGAVAAPLSYAAGGRMGAASMNPSFLKSFVTFGIVWGLAVPALFALSSAFRRAEGLQPTGSGESQ